MKNISYDIKLSSNEIKFHVTDIPTWFCPTLFSVFVIVIILKAIL